MCSKPISFPVNFLVVIACLTLAVRQFTVRKVSANRICLNQTKFSFVVTSLVIWLGCLQLLLFLQMSTNAPGNCSMASATHIATSASIADNGLEGEMARRRQFVKRMVGLAWKGAKSALGDNSILSLKHTSSVMSIKFRSLVSQDSLINALTTFAVTGMFEEFEQGRVWVETQLEVDSLDKDLDVSRVISNYIGALLSCFALTWNRSFLDKAEQLANRLKPAYQSPTGLPYQSINLSTGQTSGSLIWLSDVTNGVLEYSYLSDITDNPKYRQRVDASRQFLFQKDKPKNLYMFRLDVDTGDWTSTISTLSFASRHFYFDLVNSYLYCGGKDVEALHMFQVAMQAIQQNGLIGHSARSGLLFARDYDYSTEKHDDFMSHHSGYLGAMFSYAALSIEQQNEKSQDQQVQQYWDLARGITETCHIASERTKTKLVPARFYFDDKDEATNSRQCDCEHILSPELAQSYFVMWRTTKDPKYREYAWKMALAIEQHCLNEHGFWDIADVNQLPTKKSDYHDPHFIGGTLKYLYLTFCEDYVLPLDMWVFNAAGNPLPIGAHDKGLQTNL